MPSNDSFINANYIAPKELAKLLTSLSSNEKEYNKFMRFKNHPIPKHFKDIALMSYTHPNAACRLCAYAESMKVNNNDDKNAIEKFVIDRARPPKDYDKSTTTVDRTAVKANKDTIDTAVNANSDNTARGTARNTARDTTARDTSARDTKFDT